MKNHHQMVSSKLQKDTTHLTEVIAETKKSSKNFFWVSQDFLFGAYDVAVSWTRARNT